MTNDELPEGWAEAPFSAVTVDPVQRAPARDEEITYIDIGSVDRDTKTITQPQTMLGKDAPSRARKVVKTGDVLVSTVRPNLNAVALVDRRYDGQFASTGFDVLRSPVLDPRWVFFSVRTPAFVERMTELVQGALYPAVRSKDVRAFIIPIAPLAEQKRIADKLEAVLGRVDSCRARLDRVPDLLKRFRQSVLAAATSGQLTEDWREKHPRQRNADSLAALIRKSHADAGGHKAGNAAPPSEDIHDLTTDMFPNGWQVLTLREAVAPDRPITYGILMPGPELKEGVPYVRVADFPNDRLNLTTIRNTSLAMDEQFKRSRLRTGDLLMSIRGTVGRMVVVPPELEAANITQDTARLSIQPEISSTFVLWYLRSPMAQSRMRAATKGVAVRGMNIGDIRALQLPLPSFDEQQEIVRRVEALFALADRIEARLTAARAQVERLPPATLSKAFRGDLVPQDPNDEPASKLLERLNKDCSTSAQPRTKARKAKTTA